MDFLKNCTTNHYSAKDFSTLQYAVFKHEVDLPKSTLVTSLRHRRILCSYQDGMISVFSQDFIDPASIFAEDIEDYRLQEQGVLRSWLESDHQNAVARFKDAIEEGLAHNLDHVEDLKRLGKCTWVVDSDTGDNCCTALQLQTVVQGVDLLSFTLAAVSVPWVQASSSSQPVVGSDVILSPSGIQGKIVAFGAEEAGLSTTDEQWKHDVVRHLRIDHTSSHRSDWAQVWIQHSKTEGGIVSWPLVACFIPTATTSADSTWSRSLAGHDSAALPTPDFTDGLAFAHSWLRSATERQHKSHNHASAAANDALRMGMDVASEIDDTEAVASPVFLARPDVAQSLGVYPTPPDGMVGIAYGQPAAPVETPIDTVLQANVPDIEVGAADTLSMSDIDHEEDHALTTLARQTSMLSNPARFQRSMTDELFGDAEAGHVGDDIGDDDFDFFDTQAEVKNAQHVDPVESVASEAVQVSDTPDISTVNEVDNGDDRMQIVASSSPAHDLAPSYHASGTAHDVSVVEMPATLSHFDIMERLLPAPIPASMSIHNQISNASRRESNFGLIKFNTTPSSLSRLMSQPSASTQPGIQISESRHTSLGDNKFSHDSDDDSSSASSNAGPAVLPPTVPWSSKKRKRATGRITNYTTWDIDEASTPRQSRHASTDHMLDHILKPQGINLGMIQLHRQKEVLDTPNLESLIGNASRDLISIAQLVAEQSMSCITAINHCLSTASRPTARTSARDLTEHLLVPALSAWLPSLQEDDISSLAVQREVRAIAKPGVRAPVRQDAVLGPDLHQLQAPFLRFRRADNLVEMLPPSIQFWETLGLAPAHGNKNVRSFFVAPDNDVLHQRLADFRSDLKTTYETSRLGSFDGMLEAGDDQLRLYSAFIVNSDYHATSIYSAYKDACLRLAQRLTTEATKDPETSFAIFMVDPFPQACARHILCACFWTMYRSYLEANKSASQENVSDVCLHILPSTLVSTPDAYTMLTSEQLNFIAREIYDRCPPPDDLRTKAPISASNSILLAEPLPKRINFQLTANPPADLFHEGSELHVSYAKSKDGMWISVAWSDNVGNQQNASFCLRGFSMLDLIGEIWTRTIRILQSRHGFWRVSIATVDPLEEAESVKWQEMIKTHKPHHGSVIVLFVALDERPRLCLTPQMTQITSVNDGAPTPESSSQALIMSPEASGHVAPPTPAASDGVEADADAHLVDLTDETYCILLNRDCHSLISTAVASGMMFKRGLAGENEDMCLPSLGVDAVWIVKSKSGEADSEVDPRRVELMLKEIMSSYRNLAVLAKIRGLQRTGEEMLPIHVLGAKRGAEALMTILDHASG